MVPRNDPALVDAVARRFGFLPADQIRLHVAEGRRAQLPVGDAVSVGRLLTEFVELQQVATRKQIQIMSEHTRCPVTKPKLLAYVGDDDASAGRYRSEVLGKRKSVFDLLEEHPACELPFHAYLEMLSVLSPRYYSISSSPARDPSRCSVTVAVVEAPASSGRGIYRGVCSSTCNDDAMAGRHILAGDVLIFEHGREPRPGEIVAAFVDGESVVRSYVLQDGRPFLKAAHPDQPDLIPAQELVIQGTLVRLTRDYR